MESLMCVGASFAVDHAHPNPPVSYPQHPKFLPLLKHTAVVIQYSTVQWCLAPGAAAHVLSVLLSTALSTTPAFLQ